MVKWRLGHYHKTLHTQIHQVTDIKDRSQTADSSAGQITTLLSSLSPFVYRVPLNSLVDVPYGSNCYFSRHLNLKHPFSDHLEAPFTSPECYFNSIAEVEQNRDSGVRCPLEHFGFLTYWRCLNYSRKQNRIFFFFFSMNPGCIVGSQQALTVDDRYFQKPPAEQFISLSSTCTALLNNAQWWKTTEARCCDAQLCIHEELIAAAVTLFIQPLHVFMFYTPCRKSQYITQQPAFTPCVTLASSPHRSLICLL